MTIIMARDKKARPRKRKGGVKEQEKPSPAPTVQEDVGTDYGGLPDRNLKKNLGCG
jgi:hypothetical protein